MGKYTQNENIIKQFVFWDNLQLDLGELIF